MIDKILSILKCPFCGTAFKNVKILRKNPSKEGIYGIIKCNCDEFPIVEDIFYLKKDDLLSNRKIVENIKKQKKDKAVWNSLAFTSKRHKILIFTIFVLQKYLNIILDYKFVLRLFSIIGPSRSWFKYLSNRESLGDPQHSLDVMEKSTPAKPGVIIDVGYGLGDFQRMLAKNKIYFNRYIGIDKNFFSLLTSQIFHKPKDAILVCCDVNFGLPIKSKEADFVLFLDSYWQMHKKKLLIDEAARVLKQNGKLMIINMYKTNKHNYYYGYGLNTNLLKSFLSTNFKKIKIIINILLSKDRDTYSLVAQKK